MRYLLELNVSTNGRAARTLRSVYDWPDDDEIALRNASHLAEKRKATWYDVYPLPVGLVTARGR